MMPVSDMLTALSRHFSHKVRHRSAPSADIARWWYHVACAPQADVLDDGNLRS